MININLKPKDINRLSEVKVSKSKEINITIEYILDKFNMIFENDERISEVAYDNLHKKVCYIIREKYGEKLKRKLEKFLIIIVNNKIKYLNFNKLDTRSNVNLVNFNKNNNYYSNLDIINYSNTFNNFISFYEEYIEKCKLLKKLLFYYELNYINKHNYLEFIQFSKQSFKKSVIFFDIIEFIQDFLTQILTKERNNCLDYQITKKEINIDEELDRTIVNKLISIVLNLDINLYYKHIEDSLIKNSIEYYNSLHIKLLYKCQNSTNKYLDNNKINSNFNCLDSYFENVYTILCSEKKKIEYFRLYLSKEKLISLFYKTTIYYILNDEISLFQTYINSLVGEIKELSVKTNIENKINSNLIEDVKYELDIQLYKPCFKKLLLINKICSECFLEDERKIYVETFLKCLAKGIEINMYYIVKDILDSFSNKEDIIDNKKEHDIILELINFMSLIELLKKKLCDLYKNDYIVVFSNIIKQFFNDKKNIFGINKNSLSINNTNYNKDHILTKLICKTIDSNLKLSSKINNNDLAYFLDQICIVIKYIDDKDIFEHYHRKYISNRILCCKLFNKEIEIKFIQKLKIEYGSLYTRKLETMIEDIEQSKKLMLQYMNQYLHQINFNNDKGLINFFILTQSNWPFNYADNQKFCVFTKKLNNYVSYLKDTFKNNYSKYIKSFCILTTHINQFKDKFYSNLFRGRILSINIFNGNMELEYKINKTTYFINCSSIQGIICLLLNGSKDKGISFNLIKYIFICEEDSKIIKDQLKLNENKNNNINKFNPFIKKTNTLVNNFNQLNLNQININPLMDKGKVINNVKNDINYSNTNSSKDITNLNLLSIDQLTPDNNNKLTNNNTKNNFLEKNSDKLLEIKSSILMPYLIPLAKVGIIAVDNKLEIIKLNNKFFSNSNKLNIGLATLKCKSNISNSSIEINVSNSHEIANLRKVQLESTIIRIMKQNKKIAFTDLCNLIVDSLYNKFIPEKLDIKTRLENLCDRNFIKRDSENMNIYIYIN